MSSNNFQDAASATTDATGAYSVTFSTVRLGFIWTGSVQIPSAVSSSVLPVKFTAFDSGIPIGSWYNDQSSPDLQVQQQLSITASGLVASTRLQAFFKGMITPAAETPPFWPGPVPAPPPSGFTTLISGLANSTAITVNPQYLTATGGLSLTPVWFPVIVGTALEIAYFGANAVNQRLTPLWSTTGTGTGTIVHNADTFDLSFVSPNNVMQGMTYLNHGPFVAFLIQGVGGTPQIVINTGLPPIVRGPTVPQGVLSFNGGPFANGVTAFALPPYVGSAMISGEMVCAAQKFELYVTSTNYLNQFLGTTFTVDSTLDPNGVRLITPTQLFLPPTINTLNVRNGSGASAAGDFQLVAFGP